jgi:hypothetical protein
MIDVDAQTTREAHEFSEGYEHGGVILPFIQPKGDTMDDDARVLDDCVYELRLMMTDLDFDLEDDNLDERNNRLVSCVEYLHACLVIIRWQDFACSNYQMLIANSITEMLELFSEFTEAEEVASYIREFILEG